MRRALALIPALALAAGGVASLAPGGSAEAAIVVNETAAELNADGDCSLQEALATVDTGVIHDTCEVPVDGTIVLGTGTFHLDSTQALTDTVTIQGAGLTHTMIECAGLPAGADCFVHSGTADVFTLQDVSIGHAPRHGVYVTPGAGPVVLERSAVVLSGAHGIAGDPAAATVVRVERSMVAHNGGDGINVRGGAVRLVDASMISNDRGVATASAPIDVHRSLVLGNDSHGIETDGADVELHTSSLVGNEGFALTTVSGDLRYESSTVVANARAVNYTGAGSATFRNTLVALSDFGNCDNPIVSLGHNLSDDATCGFDQPSDLDGVDPLLTGMVGTGVVNPAVAVDATSPAVDAGADCDGTDQLGTPRPLDGDGDGVATCDIGAWEAPAVAVPLPPVPPGGPVQPPAQPGGPAQPDPGAGVPAASPARPVPGTPELAG